MFWVQDIGKRRRLRESFSQFQKKKKATNFKQDFKPFQQSLAYTRDKQTMAVVAEVGLAAGRSTV